MSTYSAYERETHLHANDEIKQWTVTTYQLSVIGKMKRAGIAPQTILDDGQHKYILDFNQVSFRSGKKREVSEAQRKAASERLKKARENKKGEIQ